MRVVTANVNGVRAAARRGMIPWLQQAQPDVLCLQEVRASDVDLAKVLAEAGLAHWSLAHTEGSAKGRAGVAIVTRDPQVDVRVGVDGDFADEGRWVEVDVDTDAGCLTVASAYVHTGQAGTDRQDVKMAFLDAMTRRMRRAAGADALMVVTGDLNVAHREADLKNWKGNLTKAGFLPEERAVIDGWLADGTWVDVQRAHAGDVAGPYTWWSWRGKAFDNDAGWRIDYQLATRRLAAVVADASVGRAPTYAERWSDHAPVVVDYDLGGVALPG
ncbi:exodeoxyribonuclease III [Terrabacter sp. MAHUQ-38]|jgi:exodeoxyribonuclease-3|uniref:exodeoxyribonuclease III n=1 Tax=unclassified Terrabacter TaxID=2630222 RepID=UPI00165EBA0A|nr:exodeoxyribonuclease III [Terrabacter sp. MAHUQ-38]MBC9821891.1 exodeoxyribonuclease III [Terrabacter sp. MAHUQ-38]